MAYSGGKEMQVNTFTLGAQGSSTIVGLADGSWTTIWTSAEQDGDHGGLYSQHYLASGQKEGAETLVNDITVGSQLAADSAALGASGFGFVVTWQDDSGLDGNGYGVYQQIYDAAGAKSGSQTKVNATVVSDQFYSSVTALNGGGWIVSWQSDMQDGSGYGVYFQVYNAAGMKSGGEVQANTFTTSEQIHPSITSLASGGYVVTWSSFGHPGETSGIYQQAYSGNGAKLGGETLVNTFTTGVQGEAEVTAIGNDGWVVVWESQDQDGSGYGVYQQAFNADGAKRGSEVRVNTTTAGDQNEASVTSLNNGGWAVTWSSGGDIYMQVYDASGSKNGSQTRVNLNTGSEQSEADVTTLADGRIAVSWTSFDVDGSGGAVCQRIFAPDLTGTHGKNTLDGHAYGEKIFGLGRADTLYGRGGDDTLNGGGGNDRLFGGADADIFVFKTHYGTDIVRDFGGIDRIDLSGLKSVHGFNDLMENHAHKSGGDVRIDGLHGDVLILRDTKLGELQASDFIF